MWVIALRSCPTALAPQNIALSFVARAVCTKLPVRCLTLHFPQLPSDIKSPFQKKEEVQQPFPAPVAKLKLIGSELKCLANSKQMNPLTVPQSMLCLAKCFSSFEFVLHQCVATSAVCTDCLRGTGICCCRLGHHMPSRTASSSGSPADEKITPEFLDAPTWAHYFFRR